MLRCDHCLIGKIIFSQANASANDPIIAGIMYLTPIFLFAIFWFHIKTSLHQIWTIVVATPSRFLFPCCSGWSVDIEILDTFSCVHVRACLPCFFFHAMQLQLPENSVWQGLVNHNIFDFSTVLGAKASWNDETVVNAFIPANVDWCLKCMYNTQHPLLFFF